MISFESMRAVMRLNVTAPITEKLDRIIELLEAQARPMVVVQDEAATEEDPTIEIGTMPRGCIPLACPRCGNAEAIWWSRNQASLLCGNRKCGRFFRGEQIIG